MKDQDEDDIDTDEVKELTTILHQLEQSERQGIEESIASYVGPAGVDGVSLGSIQEEDEEDTISIDSPRPVGTKDSEKSLISQLASRKLGVSHSKPGTGKSRRKATLQNSLRKAVHMRRVKYVWVFWNHLSVEHFYSQTSPIENYG